MEELNGLEVVFVKRCAECAVHTSIKEKVQNWVRRSEKRDSDVIVV